MGTARVLSVLAVAAAVVVSLALIFVDTYSGETCTPEGCTSTSSTLIEENGKGVLALLVVPVALTAAGAAAIRLRAPIAVGWTLAGALLLACFLAIASIGLVYLPAAGLLFAAVASDYSNRPRAAHPT